MTSALVILTIVIFAAVVYYMANTMSKRARMDPNAVFVRKNKRFVFYYDFFLTRSNFRKVYSQVAGLSVYTFMEGRMVTVKFFERTTLLSISLFVITYIGFQDIISGIIIFMMSMVFMDVTVYANIDKVNLEMESQLLHALTALSKAYTRCRNVPDALHDIKVGNLLQRPFNELYEIVVSSKGKERLNSFYRTTPNRTLRTLATACWTLHDQGDAELTVNTTSVNSFQLAIQMLKGDLAIERQNHLTQRLLFKGLPRLPLAPLVVYPVLSTVITWIFPATGAVYRGTIGYVCKILMLLFSFACYYTLSTINNTSVASVDDRIKAIRELLKSEQIQRFAESLQSANLRRREVLQRKIDKCLSSKDLPYFYFERFVFAVALFFTSIVLSIVIVVTSRSVIYNNIIALTLTGSNDYTAEEAERIRAMDASILAMDRLPNDDELTAIIIKSVPGLTTVEVENNLLRVKDKYKSYHNTRFHWWFCMIYIGSALIGTYIPVYLLSLRAKTVASEAQLDVLQLQTVVAILSSTTMDTMDVILWMSKSSDIHKDVLTTCYHEYARDAKRALYNLRRSSAIPEFTAMCDDLLTTVHMVSLEEAFSNLVTDRESSLKERESVEAYNLSNKRAIAGPIAQAPIVALIVFGMLIPIMVVALSSASSTFSNIK